jgi:hypothetical protein
MLDLVEDGSFEDLHPRYNDGYDKDRVRWSSIGPGSFYKVFPMAPLPVVVCPMWLR